MKKFLCFVAIFVLVAMVTPAFATTYTVIDTVIGGNLVAKPPGPYGGGPGDTLKVINHTFVPLFVTYRERYKQVITSQQIADNSYWAYPITGNERSVDFDRTGAVWEPELRYRMSGGRVPVLSTIGLLALIVLITCSAVFLWRRKIRLLRI